MIMRWMGVLGVVLVGLISVFPAAGQDLESRVTGGGDGWVAFHYATRPEVQGCAARGWRMGGRSFYSEVSRDGRHRYDDCRNGPAWVLVEVRGGEVDNVELVVAPRTPIDADRDLGEVSPGQAADLLLTLARDEGVTGSQEMLSGAFVARDVEVWPRFLEIARDRAAGSDLRKQAMFWVSQEASARVVGPLQDVAQAEDEQTGVREAAVFALSQRPDDESIPTLMEVAETVEHPEVRRAAFFWLAQKDDERVMAYFEALLRGG